MTQDHQPLADGSHPPEARKPPPSCSQRILADAEPSIAQPTSSPFMDFEDSSLSSGLSSVESDLYADSIFGSPPSRSKLMERAIFTHPSIHPILVELFQNGIRSIIRDSFALASSPYIRHLASSFEGMSPEEIVQLLTRELPILVRSIFTNNEEIRNFFDRRRPRPPSHTAPVIQNQGFSQAPSGYIVQIRPYFADATDLFDNHWDHGIEPVDLQKIEYETTQSWRRSFGPIHPVMKEEIDDEVDARRQVPCETRDLPDPQKEEFLQPSPEDELKRNAKSGPTQMAFHLRLLFALFFVLVIAFAVYHSAFSSPKVEISRAPHYYWCKHMQAAWGQQFFRAFRIAGCL